MIFTESSPRIVGAEEGVVPSASEGNSAKIFFV